MNGDKPTNAEPVATVTPPPTTEGKMPAVPLPEEKREAKRQQMQGVRSRLEALAKKRAEQAGKQQHPAGVKESESDEVKRLKSEKETITDALRALYESCPNDADTDMNSEKYAKYDKARSEAGELLALIDQQDQKLTTLPAG